MKILADEPTGCLDSDTGRSILNLLPTPRDSGLTIFRVTHDAAIARLADRIVRLKDGRLLSSLEDLMAKDPVCGMQVDEQSAAAKSEYKGQTYYFCSPGCKATFDKAPEKYASK